MIRNATIKNYQQEVTQLFSDGTSRNRQYVKLGPSPDLTATTNFVRTIVESAFPNHDVTDNQDLFVSGLDSLKVMEITSPLKTGIHSEESIETPS